MPTSLATSPSAAAVGDGLRVYGNALANAGGREVETLMRSPHRDGVCAGLYASPPYHLEVPGLPVSRLSITLTSSRVTGGIDGERTRTFASKPHSLFLTPASAGARWNKESPSRHVNLYFHSGAFSGDAIGDRLADLDRRPLLNASVPGIRPLLDQLVVELEQPAAYSAEAVDSLSRLLLIHLARHASCRPVPPQALTARGIDRVREFVVAHLAERILVPDLADVVGLAPNHFAHQFSAFTGLSPHQFVLNLRIARATELLRDSALGLAEIAIWCGFSSQQHLTRTMQSRLGITPGRYRAAVHASGR